MNIVIIILFLINDISQMIIVNIPSINNFLLKIQSINNFE